MNKDEGTKVGERVANAAALTGIGAAATGATAAAVGVATTVTTAGVSGAAIAGTGATIGGIIGGVGGAVVSAPAWAIPLAVAGGVAAVGAIGYRIFRRKRNAMAAEEQLG